METAAIGQRAQPASGHLLKHLNEFNQIALKGHLLVDESLRRIIAEHCRAASVLDDVRMSFYVKSKLARALVGDPQHAMLWGLVWRLYLIYIDVAHKTESPRVRQLIQTLIEQKCEWKAESLPVIVSDDQLTINFRDSVGTVLDALAAIEIQGHEYPTCKRWENR